MLLTDPPYNVAVSNSDGLTIQNDNWSSDDDFQHFLEQAFSCAYEVMDSGASFYVWYGSNGTLQFINALRTVGLEVKQHLIWNKSQFVLGRQDYQWKHEPCLYGWKQGATHYFTPDRTLSTVITDEQLDPQTLTKEQAIKLLMNIYANLEPTVLDAKKPAHNIEHPTMKPVLLMARQIRNSTRPGDKVLDLFGGSGSTLLAAEQLGRVAYLMELDPHYCDVIIARWEELTGRQAVRVSE